LIGAPFRSIQKAATIVNPGDTVIVKDGTYTDTDGDDIIVRLQRSGTSDKWITFRAENKWGAVLDGQANTKYGWRTNASYIRVEDFEVKNVDGGITTPEGSHIYYYRNKVHDIARRQILCSAGDALIGHTAFGGGDGTTYITWDSNLVYNIGRLPGGCPASSCTYGVNCDYAYDHGLYVHTSHATIINNIFYETKAGWAIQISGNKTPVTDWKIINNTFYGDNPQKDGQLVFWGRLSDITIQNNISYGSRNYFIEPLDNKKKMNINIKNNLVYSANVIKNRGGKFYLSNNITGQDPKFVDLNLRDFHLQEGSPAIGMGCCMETPALDFDNKKRLKKGEYCDIGAYEYIR
jgi:hypothetical protein